METKEQRKKNLLITSCVRLFEGGSKQTMLPNSVSYSSFKVGDIHYRICKEFNQFYGDIIRQWFIDDEFETNVLIDKKYAGEVQKPLIFDCSEALIGERPIEGGCMSYEFLMKGLGMSLEAFKKVRVFTFHEMMEYVRKLPGYVPLINCYYSPVV